MIGYDQLGTQDLLVPGGLVPHGVNLIQRTQVFGRVAVTVEAPGHVKSVGFDIGGHLVHAAVTGLAADSFGDMDLVVKINEIGQPVYPVPDDRHSCRPTFTDRSQLGAASPDLAVAGHAGFGRWDICETRLLN